MLWCLLQPIFLFAQQVLLRNVNFCISSSFCIEFSTANLTFKWSTFTFVNTQKKTPVGMHFIC